MLLCPSLPAQSSGAIRGSCCVNTPVHTVRLVPTWAQGVAARHLVKGTNYD